VTIASSDMNEPHDFDDALRRWADRPPATSAADAARAVVARLQAEGGRRDGAPDQIPVGQGFSLAGRLSPAWATCAAAIIVLLAGTASFIRSLPPVATGPGTGVATGPKAGGPTGMVPPRDADIVLWLDDGTPVYVFLPGDGQAMR
jgi:hypothetical protein